jgi:TonB-linked SusC/RagA family outer membrane protein
MRDFKINVKRTLGILFILLLGLSTSVALGQTRVEGTVTDANDNTTLPGVNIQVKGTTLGTTTDIDGNYTLEVPDDQNFLVFSYVGYQTLEVSIDGRSRIDVELRLSASILDEMVVVGYATQRKADLTGSVSVVDTEAFDFNISANAMQSIRGQVPGMIISSDGSPDGSVNIRIRGINSINVNTAPLFIIDGVPTTSNLNEINPQDIESMQVLKDASAASIYGSRASNGVIIITTKRGKEGETKINFKTNSGVSFFANRPRVLDSYQYGQAYWQAAINDGANPNQHYLYRYNWHYDENGNAVLDDVLLPYYLDAAQTMRTSNTDWFDETSRIGMQNSMDLSLSQGTARSSSMFSIGLYDNQGIVNTSRFSRVSMRLNSEYNMLDNRLKVGENLSFSYLQQNPANVHNLTLQTLPIIPVRTIDGEGWGGPVAGMNDRQNPVRILEDNKQNHTNFFRLFGNAYVDFKPIENLTLRSSLGIDYGNFFARNMFLSYESGYLSNSTNRVTNNQFHSYKWTWTNTVNYSISFGKSDMDFLVGNEFFNDSFQDFMASVEDFELENPDYMYLNAGTGSRNVAGGATGYRLLSYFGRTNYSYDDRYLASVTLRYDGSSRFGKNNQFGLFPAASLGWRLSEEDFIKDNTSIFSDLKLRAGWGQTGNQAIDNLARYSIFIADYNGNDPTWGSPWGTAYDIAGTNGGNLPSGYRRIRLGNDDLRWETTTQTNIGIDFGIFNHKLYGSIDYFWKTTTDMLFEPGYIGVIGEGGNQWVNGATMTNNGIELLLTYNGEINNDWRFSVTGNIATYRNEIVDLPDEVKNAYGGDGEDDNILGRPLGSFYGYVAQGIFKNPDDVANSAESIGKGLGRIRYMDLNGDGVIDHRDRTWIGIPHPDFTYGLNFTMNYRNLDFNMFWEGISGLDIINDAKYHTDFWSVRESGSNKGVRLLDAWSPANPDSDIPALTLIDSNNENRFSTYVVESGSYLKLRYFQVGYTFKFANSNIENFRVYVGGQNLLTIKKWWGDKQFTGPDPENPGWGYPIPVNLTAGINISI